MGFKCGIVGLPNVGKSTLFNALTKTVAAQAANYPFCTIEPNEGRIAVPDPRLDLLAQIAESKKIIPTFLDIVDIAGLVKGASKGEGLGNQFLANIRQVDAILHVVRCFEDDNITHVENRIDPVNDIEIIETELLLADYDALEKRKISLDKKARTGDREAKCLIEVADKILLLLKQDRPARDYKPTDDEKLLLKHLHLLTDKPSLYICNVAEDDSAGGNAWTAKVADYARAKGSKTVIISAKIEAEIAMLPDEQDKIDYLQNLGLTETGLARVVYEGYQMLDLLTFFTVGPKEARAWTTPVKSLAPQAAGVIHTDFEKGFICAETIAYDDYIACHGEIGAKTAGKARTEGRDYQVKDGDVLHFRFNV